MPIFIRRARREDIPAMQRIRGAVRENMLVSIVLISVAGVTRSPSRIVRSPSTPADGAVML